MSNLRSKLPNFLTLGNLLFGCWAIVAASEGNFDQVGLSIAFCLLLDFLDGAVARFLDVRSELGKQLDSLADVVSFGAAPGIALYFYWEPYSLSGPFGFQYEFLAFLIPLIAATRLGRFNIQDGSDHFFSGMPTPAFAIACFSIPLVCSTSLPMHLSMTQPAFVVVFCLLGSLLMISPIRFYSMKIGNQVPWLRNLRLISLLVFAGLIIAFKFFGLFLCLLAYLIISLTVQKRLKSL